MTTDLTLLPRVAYRGQEVTAPRLRALLALLAGDLRTGCSTERLVAGLWPDELPERPGKALQVLVSRARAQLGADVIVSTPTGYRLALAEEQVDASALLLHAAASADRARAGDHAGSLAAAEAGLALWEGTTDGGGDGGGDLHDPVAALRAERAPVRGALVRAQALALARLGRHAEAAGPLAVAASEHPRDEEVLAELLRGEAATAGPSAALTRYEAYRRRLRDDARHRSRSPTQVRTAGVAVRRGARRQTRRAARAEPAARPGRGHRGGRAAAARLPCRHRRRARRSRQDPARARRQPPGRAARGVLRAARRRHARTTDVAAEVASALGAGEKRPGAVGGHDPVPGILGVLGSGPALLVLDNCEQVVRGAADLVRALVSSSKDLRVLATSRAPLGLTSESVYPLPELGLATSVELFGQRARAARPGVELPPDAVAELCRHLDGLPLAVELAAARVRVLSVPEIARRLGDRFALLRGGARDAPERHRTLHAVVDWSWNLLAEEARRRCACCRSSPAASPATPPSRSSARTRCPCWSSWSTSRWSPSPTPRPGCGSGCWRPYGSSARPGGRRPARRRGRRPIPRLGAGLRGRPPRLALRLGTAGRPRSGSGPSRTTSCWRCGTPWPVRTVPPSPPSPPSSPPCGPSAPATPASPPSPRTPARRCRTTTPSPSTSKSPAPPRCCARRACSWATARPPYASSSPSGGCPRPRRTRCCGPSRWC